MIENQIEGKEKLIKRKDKLEKDYADFKSKDKLIQ